MSLGLQKSKSKWSEKKYEIIVPAVLYVYMIYMKIQIKSNLEKRERKVGSVSDVPRTMGDNLLARRVGLCNR